MASTKYFLLAGLALLIAWPSSNTAQLKILPGSAGRGKQLLMDKGCVNCHNGNRAADLSKTPPHAGTPELLASTMWNHAAEMWGSPDAARNWPARLTSMESADLFAYLYSVLYFAPPGDADRGKNLFQKKCAACHASEPGLGAAPSAWKSVSDPVMWAERMWNHSSEMSSASIRKGVPRPTLSGQDVSDLMTYLRSLPGLRAKPSFTMGEAEQGLVVFERSCESCHSFGPGPGKTIDLLARPAPKTVMGYIAEMWNHAPMMRGPGGEGPAALEPGDMSNLIAFLFSQSYFFEHGNSTRGRKVFESKNCASCHEEGRKETDAPDLTQGFEAYSPVTLTSAVFGHGPAMFQAMRQQGISRPKFQGTEMADLIAYLNSRLVKRIAPRGN